MTRFHGGTGTRLHRIWQGIRSRCQNPNAPHFDQYGGRGIKLCQRWQSFVDFRSDVGEPPAPQHTLDRIDVNGNYTPDNCRWATRSEQSRNRRNTIWAEIDGTKMCLMDAAKLRGLKYATVRDRVRRHGWTVERALSTPAISKSDLPRDSLNRFSRSV